MSWWTLLRLIFCVVYESRRHFPNGHGPLMASFLCGIQFEVSYNLYNFSEIPSD